jgi:hypothetical protein
MNEQLAHQRCFNHARREAVARCPLCARFFCRECITEHEDRVLCSACLEAFLAPDEKKRTRFRAVVRALQFSAGLLVLWLFFYYLGQTLLLIPTSFHKGTIWTTEQGERP